MMATRPLTRLWYQLPAPSMAVRCLPSGENAGVISPTDPGRKLAFIPSSPLEARSISVVVSPRCSFCDPKTVYFPSSFTATLPEKYVEALRTVPPGRSNETQARLSLDPSLVTWPSTEATSVDPSELTAWQPMHLPPLSDCQDPPGWMLAIPPLPLVVQ